jgi:hypothetical protein
VFNNKMSKVKVSLAILLLMVVLVVILIVIHKGRKSRPQYSWNAANPQDVPPEACDKPCGTGHAFRPVWCQDYKGNVVDDSFCAKLGPKPDQTVPCNTQACDWEKKQLKPCPDCGVNQFSTWEVTCPNGDCDESKKPPSQVACNINPCKWNYTDWSPGCPPCDDKTNAKQTRTASCSVSDASQCGSAPSPSDLTSACKYDSGNVCSWSSSSSPPITLAGTSWGEIGNPRPVVLSFIRNSKGNIDINLLPNSVILGDVYTIKLAQQSPPKPDSDTVHAFDVNLNDFFKQVPLKFDKQQSTGIVPVIKYAGYDPKTKIMTIQLHNEQ